MNKIIESFAKRAIRNNLLLNALLLLLVGFVWWAVGGLLYSLIRGPVVIPYHELISINNVSNYEGKYVQVTADTIINSGVVHLEDGKQDGVYEVMILRRTLLILFARTATRSNVASGELGPIPYDLRKDLIEKSDPESQKAFLPFMLNTEEFGEYDYLIFFFLALITAVPLWNVVKGTRKLADPVSSSTFKSLQPYGNPVQVARDIESEYRNRDGLQESRQFILTRSWLIAPHVFRADITNLADILWVYHFKRKIRIHFVPVAAYNSLIIKTRTGRTVAINISKERANNLMETLRKRIPWIQIGYSQELRLLFDNNKQAFIQRIEARRKQMTGA